MKTWEKLLALGVGTVAAGSVALAAYTVRGRRRTLADTEETESVLYPETNSIEAPTESWTVMGDGDYPLSAYLYPAKEPDSKKYVILTHGHTSNRNTTKRFVRLYLERGYHCINYDMRGHGSHVEKDGGIKPFLTKDEICTFGEREARDLLSLIYDAYHRFGDDITLGLHGESLGAATSMLVLKYQPRLDFVVEDCGFAEVLGVQKQVLRDRNLPEVLVYPASLAAKGLYGVAFTDIKPVEAVKESRVPLLVIHGEADELIDVENAHRIYDAAQGKKKLVLFPGALHGRSYDSDPARYQAVINEFLDEIGC